MAKEGNADFEIPADMRAFEKSVEQAKQAFDIFISAAQHAVSTAENQAVTAKAGAKEALRHSIFCAVQYFYCIAPKVGV